MNRKNVILTVAFAVLSSAYSIAQSNKVISAWKYLKDYIEYKDLASLPKAKEAIDLATVHENTKGDAKTWMYRGKIYQTLYEQNLKNETEKLKDITNNNKKIQTAYINTVVADLNEALLAYAKVKELDIKQVYIKNTDPDDNVNNRVEICAAHFRNRGISYGSERKYAESLSMYEKAIEIRATLGVTDSINIQTAAMTAEYAKNYEKAIFYYQKTIDLKLDTVNTYSGLAASYEGLKDMENAMTAIKKGRAKFPENINLMITEANAILNTGKREEAIGVMKLAIDKKPKDIVVLSSLYSALGNIYDKMAHPKDEKGKDLANPINYEELCKIAEENYLKAIEIKSDYFEALYNIGALYNNLGGYIYNKTVDPKLTKENDAKATAKFNQAIPYLEKALEIRPGDKGTMFALRQLYAKTEQQEKYDKINALMKGGN